MPLIVKHEVTITRLLSLVKINSHFPGEEDSYKELSLATDIPFVLKDYNLLKYYLY